MIPGARQADQLGTVTTSAVPLSTGCFMSQHSSLPQWEFAWIRSHRAENAFTVMSRKAPRIPLHLDDNNGNNNNTFQRSIALLTSSHWHRAGFAQRWGSHSNSGKNNLKQVANAHRSPTLTKCYQCTYAVSRISTHPPSPTYHVGQLLRSYWRTCLLCPESHCFIIRSRFPTLSPTTRISLYENKPVGVWQIHQH